MGKIFALALCAILILFLIPISLLAQQGQPPPLAGQPLADSLLKELPKQKEDTNKANLLTAISFTYYTINPDEGIKYGQRALELAATLQWKKGIGNANVRIGANYYSKSDYPKALEYYQEALKMFETIDYKKGIASATQNIGNVYYIQDDYPKALEYDFKALKMDEEIGNKDLIAMVTGNIGLVYENQSDYTKALEYDFKALKMAEEMGNKSVIANTTENISAIYEIQGDYPKALQYEFKSLKMAEEIGSKQVFAKATGNIGEIYDAQGDYSKALEYDFNALKMDEEIGIKEQIATVIGNIGNVYTHQKNYIMAITFEQKALKIAEEIGDKHNAAFQLEFIGHAYLSLITNTQGKAGVTRNGEMPEGKYLHVRQTGLPAGQAGQPDATIPAGNAPRLHKAIDYLQQGLAICKEIKAIDIMHDCYENLSVAYKLKGDYKKAMEYADDEKVIKDSVLSIENAKKLVQMQDKYDFDKKAAITRAENDKRIAISEERSKIKLIVGGSIGSAIFLISALGFFFYRKRENDKFMLTMSELKREALNAQMSDHFISNAMGSINRFIKNNDKEKASDYLMKFNRLIRKVLENSANKLESSTKKLISLNEDLEILKIYIELQNLMFAEGVLKYEINVDSNIDLENTLIPPMIFQVLAENALEHGFTKAAGGTLQLRIEKKDNRILCVVEDNGKGRDKRKEEQNNSNDERPSLGTWIAEQLVKICSRDATYKIIDLLDGNKNPIGTRVEFTLPVMLAV